MQPISPLKNTKFRTAYILKPGFRFHALKQHCDSIVFATDGVMTEIEAISSQLRKAFADFDPDQDCVVPVGTSITNLLTGYLLAEQFPEEEIVLAVYTRDSLIPDMKLERYIFYRLPLGDLLYSDVDRKESLSELD